MLLDTDLYENARQARDPHFDGRIFIGVLTTGIYCRPVCPVRLPRKENIRLYGSAAAAAEAGFRPCLRCRPESAPGTSAWLGAPAVLSRALQRIAQGCLDEEGVETLADELGISSRQLGRLFQQHLGVSPAALARTQRLHFAKKLVDETTLPMSEICYAAGYSSVRRFNAAFQSGYGRAPLSLRRARSSDPGGSLQLTLHYRPPFAWRTMLEFLARRSIPGVELISGNSYARTIEIDGVPGFLRLTFDESSHRCVLETSTQHTRHLFRIVQRVRQMFDLNAVSTEIENHLAQDPFFRPIVERFSGTRVPVAWDGFEVAVRAVLGQQVTVKAATTLVGRLVRAFGKPSRFDPGTNEDPGMEGLDLLFPAPQVLAQADLHGLGITGARVAAIKSLANLVCRGELPFDGSIGTDEFVRRVTAVAGIGPWTAQYIALRALSDPDAFPDSDLILLRAAASGDEVLKPATLRARAEKWRPWRAYAVLFLWQNYAPGEKQ